MTTPSINQILDQIAVANQTTAEEVRNEIWFTMQEAQQSTDPTVQARWAAIPRAGTELTIEEFIAHLINNR